MAIMDNHYVYAYLRENGTPYYIGRGVGRRAWTQHRVNGKGVHTPRDKSRIQLVAVKLTKFESLILEKRLVSQFGRSDLGTGILKNRKPGGEVGGNGNAGKPNWNSGKTGVRCGVSKGNVPWNAGKQGLQTAWNKGRAWDDTFKENLSKLWTGVPKTKCSCLHCKVEISVQNLSRHIGKHHA